MPALALTGSIGSGKSLVLRELGRLLQAVTFSADEENRRLLDEDEEVKKLIETQLGKTFYRQTGHADRKALFNLISKDISARKKLESILHPRLQALWKPNAEKFSRDAQNYFIAEIPLLYENQLEVFFDKAIVVGCSDQVRRERLQQARSLSATEAADWLKIQALQDSKVTKADHLLWNDGSLEMIHQQIALLASQFHQS